MTLMHEPFRSFRDLDRMTDRLAGQLLSGRAPAAMPMDVWRDGTAYHVTMDLPGVRADDIDLQVERGTLTVSATRRTVPSAEEDGAQVLVAERAGGTFTRQLVLGDGLDVEGVQAEHVDGVLHLTIPVAQAAQPRRIRIGGGQSEERPREQRVLSSSRVPEQGRAQSEEREREAVPA